MIGLLALVGIVILGLAITYAYQNRKEPDGTKSPFGHILDALSLVVIGLVGLMAVVLTLNALDLIGR